MDSGPGMHEYPEANISYFPSRGQEHELLPATLDVTANAKVQLDKILRMVAFP